MTKYRQSKRTGEWQALDESTGIWESSPGPDAAPDAVSGVNAAAQAVGVPTTPETRAIQGVADMPPWKRRLGITAVSGLKGVLPDYLHKYAAPQGLDKVEEIIQAGEKEATGKPYGWLSTTGVSGLASLPTWLTGQAAVTGVASKIPLVNKMVGAAQELPGLFKGAGAMLGRPVQGSISVADKAKGLLARAGTGALVFPGVDAVVRGEKPTLAGAGFNAAGGALLGPGAFKLGHDEMIGKLHEPPVVEPFAAAGEDVQANIDAAWDMLDRSGIGIAKKEAPGSVQEPPFAGIPSALQEPALLNKRQADQFTMQEMSRRTLASSKLGAAQEAAWPLSQQTPRIRYGAGFGPVSRAPRPVEELNRPQLWKPDEVFSVIKLLQAVGQLGK